MNQNKDGIVLNRMYVGDYLSTNLGHEVINMFQAEDDKHYLYLNAKGNFTKKGESVGTMLLVRGIGEGRVEVIGMAKNLKCVDGACCTLPRDLEKINTEARSAQNAFLKNVKYGKVSIFDIFGTQGQQSVYASYWVTDKEFFVPKEGKRLIIEFSNSSKVKEERIEGGEYITLTNHNFASTSLHQFILEGEDLDRLKGLCDVEKRADIWRLDNTKLSERSIGVKQRKISLFDICQIQNDENRFSNALHYFMEQYPNLWVEFFAQEGLNIELSDNFTVTREEEAKIKKATLGKKQMTQGEELSADSEKDSTTNSDKSKSCEALPSGGRIDLLIRDNKNIIVIENKIKSDINLNSEEQKKQQGQTTNLTSKQNTTQLDRYFNYINWRTGKYSDKEGIPTPYGDDLGKTPHFFILAPNYNKPKNTLSGVYKVITYKELYNFLKLRPELEGDANFKAFFEAMHRHTHEYINDYLYYEMMEKFALRIKKFKDNK